MLALPGDVLAALLVGGGVLAVVLVLWLLLHHSRPQLNVDVGVRGWIKLRRPPEPQPEHDDPDD